MPLFAHFGIGLMAKRLSPETNVWGLMVAAMVPDILAVLIIFIIPPGINPTPWTHGLMMDLIWALVAGIITFLITHKKKTAILIAILVFSHWVLDFIGWPLLAVMPDINTGVPILFDMNLTAGLGLYKTLAGALIFEIGVFSMGIIIYILTKRQEPQK